MKSRSLVHCVAFALFALTQIPDAHASGAFCHKATNDITLIALNADNALSTSTDDNMTGQIIDKEQNDILNVAVTECGSGNVLYIPSKFVSLVGIICDFSKSIIVYPGDGGPTSSDTSAITMCVMRDEENEK